MYFGQSVSELCANGRCCDGFMWNENTQNCIACPDGFIGKKCERACIYPNYGKECQFYCRCSEALCNISVGCVQVLESTTHESSRRMLHSTHVKVVKQTTTSVVLYPDKYHGTAGQHHSLTTVNVTTHRDETNVPDTKKQASYHPLNATEYVIKVSILVLFGISVVLVMAIFYVYIRQKMYIQPYEASSS